MSDEQLQLEDAMWLNDNKALELKRLQTYHETLENDCRELREKLTKAEQQNANVVALSGEGYAELLLTLEEMTQAVKNFHNSKSFHDARLSRIVKKAEKLAERLRKND